MPAAETSCAPDCGSPVQIGDAGADSSGNPGNPVSDAAFVARDPRDVGTNAASDAGGSDAAPVVQDAGAADDAALPSAPEGGAGNRADAGAPGADGGKPGPECLEREAASGEPCSVDADCAAGLLCDAANGTCRAIAKLELLFSFSPSGRTNAYSEGLDFAHGSLWQSTPMTLLRIDVAARAVVASYPAPSQYAEGLTWSGNVLYNAAYRNSNLYAAELMDEQLTFESLGQLQMTGGCAYGIVDHCGELFTTRCGRSVVDVYASGTTMPILRTFTVSDTRGAPLPEVEDMEIYRGQLWTSTFNSREYASTLFRVDMKTNRAVAAYEIPCSTIALDGVAADPATRTLYVTGKDCPIFVYRVD